MELFIETSLSNFTLFISSNNKIIYLDSVPGLKMKSSYLPKSFAKSIKELDLSPKDIKSIYVTTGPGSFMGSRAGLLFAKIFCLTTNAKLNVLNTFNALSIFYKEPVIKISKIKYINSSGEVIESNTNISNELNLDDIKKDVNGFYSKFKLITEPLLINTEYSEGPKID